MNAAKTMISRGNIFLPVVACLLIVVFWVFGQICISRFHYQTGVELLSRKQFDLAEHSLNKAFTAIPGGAVSDLENADDRRSLVFNGDLQRIDKAFGDLFRQRAAKAKEVKMFFAEIKRAGRFYQAAVEIDPDDIDAATGLARSTAELEKISQYINPGLHSPRTALVLFERLLQLRPKGIEAHWLLLHYLYGEGEHEKMLLVARRLVTLFPRIYYQLKKEPYYSPTMESAVEQGLQDALTNKALSKEANKVLADLVSQQGKSAEAVDYYRRSLEQQQDSPINSDYIRMGDLYLKNGELERASTVFISALRESDRPDAVLRQIWTRYLAAKQFPAFIDFCQTAAGEMPIAEIIELLQAYCFMELGQFDAARTHLLHITDRRYQAESYGLKAKMAAKEQNWDEMELAGHAATVLEPDNNGYQSLFIEALKKQKKTAAAERAATRAIDDATSPNAWRYSSRAWIRMSMKNYQGAGEDWRTASSLAPEQPEYIFYLVLAAEGELDYQAALEHARRALQLAPDNLKYQKKVNDLNGKLGNLGQLHSDQSRSLP